MERNSNIKIIGGLLVISTIISLYFSYGFSPSQHDAVTLFIMNLFSACSVFPRGLPLIFSFLAIAAPLMQLILVWQLVVLICGVGILRFNNLARKIFVILCVFHIITFLFTAVLSMPNRFNSSGGFGEEWDTIFSVVYFFVGLIPIVYARYLTYPKVREQFK